MISVDTTFVCSSATRPVSGATLKNNMKCISNNIHNFILLPSFVLSFIHIYVLTPLEIRCGRCGMKYYHEIAYEQYKRNWWDSFLTMPWTNTENTMWKLSSDVRGRKRSYIDIRKLVVRPIYRRRRGRSLLSVYICS